MRAGPARGREGALRRRPSARGVRRGGPVHPPSGGFSGARRERRARRGSSPAAPRSRAAERVLRAEREAPLSREADSSGRRGGPGTAKQPEPQPAPLAPGKPPQRVMRDPPGGARPSRGGGGGEGRGGQGRSRPDCRHSLALRCAGTAPHLAGGEQRFRVFKATPSPGEAPPRPAPRAHRPTRKSSPPPAGAPGEGDGRRNGEGAPRWRSGRLRAPPPLADSGSPSLTRVRRLAPAPRSRGECLVTRPAPGRREGRPRPLPARGLWGRGSAAALQGRPGIPEWSPIRAGLERSRGGGSAARGAGRPSLAAPGPAAFLTRRGLPAALLGFGSPGGEKRGDWIGGSVCAEDPAPGRLREDSGPSCPPGAEGVAPGV